MHNLILDHYPFAANEVDNGDAQHNMVPGAWMQETTIMDGLLHVRGHNYSRQIKAQRDYLAKYYCSEAGAVPWQERMVYPRGRPQDI